MHPAFKHVGQEIRCFWQRSNRDSSTISSRNHPCFMASKRRPLASLASSCTPYLLSELPPLNILNADLSASVPPLTTWAEPHQVDSSHTVSLECRFVSKGFIIVMNRRLATLPPALTFPATPLLPGPRHHSSRALQCGWPGRSSAGAAVRRSRHPHHGQRALCLGCLVRR